MTLPVVGFKTEPRDFVVEEIPAYLPSGSGDHVYIRFQKTGLTTDEVVQRLGGALRAPMRDAGYAGIKDKHAVTTQWASFLLPKVDPAPMLASFADHPQLRIEEVSRHVNKLKPGHLFGNKFTVRLRRTDASPASLEAALGAALADAAKHGVPNLFGDQRFGRAGKNAEFARRVVLGEAPAPRDKKRARFLFSSLQSELFNALLEKRFADGTWSTVLPGDVAKKEENGALFDVPLGGAPEEIEEIAHAKTRAAALELCATGPMFGASMREPKGAVADLERGVLEASGVPMDAWTKHRHLGEGTRRALRLVAKNVAWRALDDGDLEVEFVLGKGSYATTFLETFVELSEPARGPKPEGDAGAAAAGEANAGDDPSPVS